MNNYGGLIIRRADIDDVDRIYNIIQTRCKWLDDNNIEQWNVTRTYSKDYYLQKINSEVMYVAVLNNVVRNIYDCRQKSV